VLESRRRDYCYKIVPIVRRGLLEYVRRKSELDDDMRMESHQRSDRYATGLLIQWTSLFTLIEN